MKKIVLFSVIAALFTACSTDNLTGNVDATTGATMNNRTKLTVSGITATSAKATWTTHYKVPAWTLTVSTGSSTVVSRSLTSSEVSSRSVTITGLTAGTSYTMMIRQDDGSQLKGYKPSGASADFTTTK